jgi:hypothetical protein
MFAVPRSFGHQSRIDWLRAAVLASLLPRQKKPRLRGVYVSTRKIDPSYGVIGVQN